MKVNWLDDVQTGFRLRAAALLVWRYLMLYLSLLP